MISLPQLRRLPESRLRPCLQRRVSARRSFSLTQAPSGKRSENGGTLRLKSPSHGSDGRLGEGECESMTEFKSCAIARRPKRLTAGRATCALNPTTLHPRRCSVGWLDPAALVAAVPAVALSNTERLGDESASRIRLKHGGTCARVLVVEGGSLALMIRSKPTLLRFSRVRVGLRRFLHRIITVDSLPAPRVRALLKPRSVFFWHRPARLPLVARLHGRPVRKHPADWNGSAPVKDQRAGGWGREAERCVKG